MSMATALPGKLKKKLRKGGKTKTNDKAVNPVGDATSHETEEKPSSRLPLSDKKPRGRLTQASCNTEKNPNKSLERGTMAPKMSHSLDHPGSPDCLPVPPHPNNQSLEVNLSNSSQQTGTPGSSAISAVGGAESSCGIGSSSDTHEFTLPGNAASVADEPQNMVNRASGSLGTSAGNGPLQSNQEASDAAAFGQPPNPTNSDLVASSVSATSNMSPQVDQAGSNHSNSPPQPNASNSGISTNRVSASHTLSQADQTSAAISSATRGSETPEGAASGTDGSNVSQQPNAPSSAVSPGEGEEHHQSLTPFSVQVAPEGEVEHSTSDEGRTEEEEAVNNNYETLKVSEKIAEHKFLQDKLTLHLDHTSHRIIKGWEDLACTREINAPLEVRLRCKLSSQNSCTMMLFDVVAAEENKTLKDLMDALVAIKRNDVKKIITDVYPDAASSTQDLNEFVTKTVNSNILAKMATLLDQKSRVNQYWLHLGHQFKLSGEKLKELEYGQYTQVIMAYLYSAKSGLTIGTFYDEVKKLKRQDVLKKLDPFIVVEEDRNKRMKDVIKVESDAMAGICVCLNNPNKVLKNWRHLARSPVLGIPDEVLRGCTPEMPKSPTESLFEWIYGERRSLTIGQLCRALERIDRNDVVRDIKECFQRQPISDQ